MVVASNTRHRAKPVNCGRSLSAQDRAKCCMKRTWAGFCTESGLTTDGSRVQAGADAALALSGLYPTAALDPRTECFRAEQIEARTKS